MTQRLSSAHNPGVPHLCLFTDSLDPSGVGEHMLSLARELRVSWNITFACPRGRHGEGFLQRARELGLQVLALDVDADEVPSNEQLRLWLSHNPCQVFHAHAGIGWEGHAAIYTAREAGCAVVRTEHLPYLITDPAQVEDHKRLLASVHRLICVSQAARNTFLGHGFDATQIKMVRNGIEPSSSPADPSRASGARADLRNELNLPLGTPLLLTVGRFTEQKGHEFLLRALPLLDQMQPGNPRLQTRLLWVGQGRGHESLQAQARSLHLEDRVLFLGQRRDIDTLMLASDAFVLPSLFEGLPLVILEAMACGLPVVGTRVCGTEEAIESDRFGWLVPPCDSSALAHELSQVLARPGEAARRAERARERFRREFRAARMARETGCVYREAMEVEAG